MSAADRRETVQALRQSAERYRALLESMDQAFCVFEMLFDSTGRASDYRFLEINPAFVRMTGWATAVGVRMLELAPNHERHWFEIYGRVALTGEPIRFIQRAAALDGRWFDLYAFRVGEAGANQVAVQFTDITDRKRTEEALASVPKDLAAIIDLAPSFMCVLRGPSLVFEVANEAYRRLAGQRELIGRTVREAFPELVGQGFLELLERVYTTGEPWVGRDIAALLRMRRDEPPEVRHLDLVYQALRGDDGTVTGVFAHGIDITERKLAEEALRKAAEQAAQQSRVFDTTLSAINDFAYTFDREGRFVYVNKALLDLWGLQLADAVGRNFFDLKYPDELAARLQSQIQQVFDTRKGIIDETAYTSPTGAGGYYEYIFRPVLDTEGNVELVVGSTRDITTRKQTEDALKEADRRKTEFLAMLAHELRNPLAPIRSALHLLRLPGGSAQSAEPVYELMDRQVTQMVRLIDDLLDVSRIAQGKIALRPERVDLAAVVQHAIETVRPLCITSEHELTVSMPGKAVQMNADPARLTQVVGNLLNNACKFTPPGGRIHLEVELSGDDVVIRVADSGVGIDPGELSRIFEMFTQLDTSIEQARAGLGIGLTLVKDLVEKHGGSVEARSGGLGEGSEFLVRLPRDNGLPLITPQEPDASAVESIALRILVVDDNLDAVETLGMLLKLSGHEVHTAHDGLEAVEKAARLQPDVVLLDIGLPKLDGYEVARRILEQRETDVTLVAMTGWGQEDDRRRSKEAGFDAHLVKPVGYRDLTKLLVELCRGRT
jgi:PAS domain S-box-containing protein